MLRAIASAFSGGVVVCPICQQHPAASASGLMRHITLMHARHSLVEEEAAVLRFLDRPVCTDTQCCGINRIGVRRCIRYCRATTFRPLRAGDVVPGPCDASMMPAASAEPMSQQLAATEDVNLRMYVCW